MCDSDGKRCRGRSKLMREETVEEDLKRMKYNKRFNLKWDE
jgi:hypothetical protein